MTEGADAPAPSSKRNLRQQADFIASLIARCVSFEAKGFAGNTYLFLRTEDCAALDQISRTLQALAPHEAAIKRTMSKGT